MLNMIKKRNYYSKKYSAIDNKKNKIKSDNAIYNENSQTLESIDQLK